MRAGTILALSAGVGSLPAAAGRRPAVAATAVLQRPAAYRPARSRAALRVQAFAQGCSFDGTYERVLRYPDGKVRRIRYPLPAQPREEPAAELEDVTDGCWATECWVPREQHWGGPSSRQQGATATMVASTAAAPPPPAFHPLAPPPAEPQPLAEPERTQLPSSPMELLRYLTSPEHKKSQEQLWEKVRGSYEVLTEVPWVAPKPLYLLAQQQQPSAAVRQLGELDAAPGLTYTLRTRVSRQDQEAELSKVLKRRAADGSPLIRCSEMKDGVVAFEDEADAERYGHMVEADGGAEVSVARCDSHALFRSVQDVKGAVVLLRRGGAFLPQPHQLATSLRSQAGAQGQDPLFD